MTPGLSLFISTSMSPSGTASIGKLSTWTIRGSFRLLSVPATESSLPPALTRIVIRLVYSLPPEEVDTLTSMPRSLAISGALT